MIALPALLTVYLSLHAGGYFPATPALVALVLGQIMVLRTTMAERPCGGYSRSLAIACAALALYALWGLGSALWSHALGRALVEFDRILMYLLVLVVFGSMRWSYGEARWMLRLLTLGLVAVCALALLSRVLPNLVPTGGDFAQNRLSYPLTYWNALGLVAALGVVFCLFLTSDARGHPAVRVLGAAGLPVAATTLYFTLSRGAIAACIIGLVVFVLVARPRGLVAGALALAAPVAIALSSAYDADLLVGGEPTSRAAVLQGHHVALVVLLCVLGAAALRALLCRLDTRVARANVPRLSRARLAALAGGALALVLILTFATGFSDRVAQDYRDFVGNRGVVLNGTDQRSRLTDPSSDGRIDHWRVAADALGRAPLKGTGLGTYEIQWARDRPSASVVVNAHSLYIETLSDLGIVGGLLLVLVLLVVLGAFARRARGPERALYGTLLAAGVAWALHSGVDWDWQMPATTLWLFAFGGVALSRRRAVEPTPPAQRWRLIAGVGWLALLVTPLLIFLSQSRLHEAEGAFGDGNCPRASSQALSSISTLDVRPEPYEILGYCDMRAGNANTAVLAMQKATKLDPDSWEPTYGLALALAGAGRDPTAALRLAVRQNPRQTLIRTALPGLSSPSAARRQAAARDATDVLLGSEQLSLSR